MTTNVSFGSAFLKGVSRLFDFGGSIDRHEFERIRKVTDKDAIASDWRYVGQDMWTAIQIVANEQDLNVPQEKCQ